MSGRLARFIALVAFVIALPTACRHDRDEVFLTYFNGDYGLSVRYPASWKTEQAEQDGVWYRYFLGPPLGPSRKPAVSATLLAGSFTGSLDDYAKTYVADNKVESQRDESRPGAPGRAYVFHSADNAKRYTLLLLLESGHVYGLYAQGEAAPFAEHSASLAAMEESLTLERAGQYPEERNDRFGYSIRTPPSWKATRRFSSGGTYLMEWSSPAFGMDKSRDTLNASLTLTVEPLGESKDVGGFYDATRQKLGDTYLVLSHQPWRDGFADLMRSETPLTVSRGRRYFRVAGGRGYSLAFVARDDVFPKVSRWCDIIASTLKIEAELSKP